jgi:glycosyltransferase involved in cell wall biosynthesis
MSEAVQVLTASDLFVFPSISESFGYVIFEALLAGCPVVIGTDTPWQGLTARGIGHDLPLDDPARFAAVIQEYIDMPADRFEECSQRAFAAAVNLVNERTGVKELRDLFNTALARG